MSISGFFAVLHRWRLPRRYAPRNDIRYRWPIASNRQPYKIAEIFEFVELKLLDFYDTAFFSGAGVGGFFSEA